MIGDRPQVDTFRLFVASRMISWFGSTLTLVALPLLLFQRTGSASLAGLLAGLEALPYLLLGLPAGALVDRWDARRTMVVSTWLSAAVMVTVPVAETFGVLTTGHLMLTALSVSSLFVFFDAASFGALPALVGRDGVAVATSRMVSVSTVIGLAGPAIGGYLASTTHAATVLGLDAATYAASALLLTRVQWPTTDGTVPFPRRHDTGAGARIRGDILEGVAYIWQHRVIRALTLLGAASSVTAGAVTGLVVVVSVRQLGLPDDDGRIGMLFVAAAAGSLLGSLALPRAQRALPTGVISLAALCLSWVAVVVWSQTTRWVMAAVVLWLWQAANTVVIVNGIVVRQSLTPTHLQGRVNTTARMIAWGGSPLGAALGGVAADRWSTQTALLLASAGVGLASVVGLLGPLRHSGTLATLRAAYEGRPDDSVGPVRVVREPAAAREQPPFVAGVTDV